MSAFIQRLKEVVLILSLEPKVKGEIQGIIEHFAFALTFYNKFEDLWNRIFFT